MLSERVFYFPGQLGEAARFRVLVHPVSTGRWHVASEHLSYERAHAHALRLDARYCNNTAISIEHA
jgi:hypothetical protein